MEFLFHHIIIVTLIIRETSKYTQIEDSDIILHKGYKSRSKTGMSVQL